MPKMNCGKLQELRLKREKNMLYTHTHTHTPSHRHLPTKEIGPTPRAKQSTSG